MCGMKQRSVMVIAKIVGGDREDLSGFEDESVDELVSLGSHLQSGRMVAECNRVLKPNGILRLGAPNASVETLRTAWGRRLEQLGFTPVEDYAYDYGPNKIPYTILSWKKPEQKKRT